MKSFVEAQVAERGYGSSSEYVRELIRKEQDRQHLRALIVAGIESGFNRPFGAAYFDALRQRAHQAGGDVGAAEVRAERRR